jgi:Cd2+/Zn2+-exporting ATPase
MPVEKSGGTKVFAGTINQTGLLKVRATGVGADHPGKDHPPGRGSPGGKSANTALYRALRPVLHTIYHRVERRGIPDQPRLELGLTLLVIGCPGALVISTPVSVVAGIGRAAKAGILIKGGEYLENAGNLGAGAGQDRHAHAGQPRVTDIIALAPEPVGEAVAGEKVAWLAAKVQVLLLLTMLQNAG